MRSIFRDREVLAQFREQPEIIDELYKFNQPVPDFARFLHCVCAAGLLFADLAAAPKRLVERRRSQQAANRSSLINGLRNRSDLSGPARTASPP